MTTAKMRYHSNMSSVMKNKNPDYYIGLNREVARKKLEKSSNTNFKNAYLALNNSVFFQDRKAFYKEHLTQVASKPGGVIEGGIYSHKDTEVKYYCKLWKQQVQLYGKAGESNQVLTEYLVGELCSKLLFSQGAVTNLVINIGWLSAVASREIKNSQTLMQLTSGRETFDGFAEILAVMCLLGDEDLSDENILVHDRRLIKIDYGRAGEAFCETEFFIFLREYTKKNANSLKFDFNAFLEKLKYIVKFCRHESNPIETLLKSREQFLILYLTDDPYSKTKSKSDEENIENVKIFSKQKIRNIQQNLKLCENFLGNIQRLMQDIGEPATLNLGIFAGIKNAKEWYLFAQEYSLKTEDILNLFARELDGKNFIEYVRCQKSSISIQELIKQFLSIAKTSMLQGMIIG